MSFEAPQSILITGATGAIGGALALHYAAPGVTLILQGRNPQRLQAIAAACEAKGARVVCQGLDVTDTPRLMEWAREVDARMPLDLVIANAGINTNIGADKSGEPWEEATALIDTNLRATMALVHAVLPGMRQRGRGQIVLISSLAAYFGLPVTPTYSATKAAVKAYGEALRGWLAPEGIRVNVVMPGYVASPMCHAMPGPKPFLWPAERAARRIRRGLEKNRARISFPFPLNLGTWFLAVLPASISGWIVAQIGYRG